MASPDLSGVLFEPKRKIVYKTRDGKVIKTETKPVFEVDDNGSIKVESMKGSKYYEFAKSCDSEIQNGLLQCDEIRQFLGKFSDKNVDTDTKDLMYYRETNDKGNVIKICTLVKKHSANYTEQQFTFNYDNDGKLLSSVLYQTPGHKYEGAYIYDLEHNHGTTISCEGDTVTQGRLTETQIKNTIASSDVAKNQQETVFSKFTKWLKSW